MQIKQGEETNINTRRQKFAFLWMINNNTNKENYNHETWNAAGVLI